MVQRDISTGKIELFYISIMPIRWEDTVYLTEVIDSCLYQTGVYLIKKSAKIKCKTRLNGNTQHNITPC